MIIRVRFIVQIAGVVELDGVAGLGAVFAVACSKGLFFEGHCVLFQKWVIVRVCLVWNEV